MQLLQQAFTNANVKERKIRGAQSCSFPHALIYSRTDRPTTTYVQNLFPESNVISLIDVTITLR